MASYLFSSINSIATINLWLTVSLIAIYQTNTVSGQLEPAIETMVLEPAYSFWGPLKCGSIENEFFGYTSKSLYKSTWLLLTLECPDEGVSIASVSWKMLSVQCLNLIGNASKQSSSQDEQLKQLCRLKKEDPPPNTVSYLTYDRSFTGSNLKCTKGNGTITFPMNTEHWMSPTPTPTKPTTPMTSVMSSAQQVSSRRKRDAAVSPPSVTRASPPAGLSGVSNGLSGESRGPPTITNAEIGLPSTATAQSPSTSKATKNKTTPPVGAILRTESDGVYVFILSVILESPAENVKNLTVKVVPLAGHGHLSGMDWPLLPFYAVMFVIYALYLIVWLVLCCCYRKDILQVQYWITGVIFLGLLEKTVFLGEYDTLNRTGFPSVYGALILGELLSCAKKTLSRMLVIVVSIGFGIVKPRLGTTLHKVLAVGFIYFIACAVEGVLRVNTAKPEIARPQFIPDIILAIVDAGICWWIFSALVQTMRTLRLRRNLVKLSLYRHFTHTLIFAVLASVIFMIWSIKQHRTPACLKDWKQIWVDDAFWHLLFSILLLVIIILWRPSASNQRYAYSHLQDAEDVESEEPMINTAHDGIKMRSKSGENGAKMRHHGDDETDDDLKWIEENIPTSLADSALPSLLDSDEEIAISQNELRKMH